MTQSSDRPAATILGGVKTDVSVSHNVIQFPQAVKSPTRRVEIVSSPVAGEYQVGVGWEDGRWIICGACPTLTDAMELAVNRADALGGLSIWDFSGIDGGE